MVRAIKIFLCLAVAVISGCHTVTKNAGALGLVTQDCMPERKDQETLSDEKGSIIKVAEYYIILSNDGNSRYLPCNLPDTFKQEGQKVKYTLITKEIYPNERHMATPCYLTKIE